MGLQRLSSYVDIKAKHSVSGRGPSIHPVAMLVYHRSPLQSCQHQAKHVGARQRSPVKGIAGVSHKQSLTKAESWFFPTLYQGQAFSAGQGWQADGAASRVHSVPGAYGASEGQRPATAHQVVHPGPVLAL